MNPYLLLGIYCLVVMAASLFGGALPSRLRLSHRNVNLVMAFVAGVILGIGIFHLLPHGIIGIGNLDVGLWAMMLGLIVMFLLTRTLHGQHQVAAKDGTTKLHDHAHAHHSHPEKQRHSWIALAGGMALHSIFDGVALAASVMNPHESEHGAWAIGFGAFLAISLHKPLDAMSVTSLIAHTGGSKKLAHAVNVGFALIIPIGAALFLAGASSMKGNVEFVVGIALAFSAGVFVSIALGDLLPELHFHPRDRLRLSSALIAGVLVAHLIGKFEPAHLHDHSPTSISGHSHSERPDPAVESHEGHDHDDHSDHDSHNH